MRNVRALMVMCQNSGTGFYRFFNFWQGAHRTGKAEFYVLGWEKNLNEMAPWQYQIEDAQHQPKLFSMLFNAGREADVIIFQRLETEAALTTFYAMKDQFPDTPILAEIDDDIIDIAGYNQASEFIKPGSVLSNIALTQFGASDGIIVSTPYLKEVYSDYNSHVYVVPNSIDVQKWDRARRKKRPGVRIGWIGATSHTEDLRLLENVIPRVLASNPEARFVFVSAHIPDFLKGIDRVDVVEKWSPILKYPDHLAAQDFDMGLAPLVDNKFNRAKSNLRWLEYSALGVPCVASNVGHFKETVRNGIDGFLANNEDEFVAHIQNLISSHELRKQIGKAAHTRIAQDFNVDLNIDIYIKAIEDVMTRPAKAAPSILTGTDDMKEIAECVPMTAEELGVEAIL